MGSALSSFILAHQAGLVLRCPGSGRVATTSVVLLPSPLTATDPIFVHLHTDFWERAEAYVRGGGALYASLAANAPFRDGRAVWCAHDRRRGRERPDAEDREAFGDLRPGETLHFSVPAASTRYWGTDLSSAMAR